MGLAEREADSGGDSTVQDLDTAYEEWAVFLAFLTRYPCGDSPDILSCFGCHPLVPLPTASGGGIMAKRDPHVTSRIMSAVRDSDSKAELILRSAIHSKGYRYRLRGADLPVRPGLVFRRQEGAVFVDDGFWHGNSWRLREPRPWFRATGQGWSEPF